MQNSQSPTLVLLFLQMLIQINSISSAEKPSQIKILSNLPTQLSKLPSVHSVTSTPTKSKPKQIVIHLLNWHFVSKEDFAVDISDGKLTEAEIDNRYLEFLNDVEAIRKEQKQILRYLIKQHNVKSVYMEGLTEKNLSAFNSFIKTLREFEVPDGNGAFDLFLKDQYRRDLMQMGAAAQLLISNELKAVLPLENAEAFEAANPVNKDGEVRFDESKEEKREDEMLKIIMKGKGMSVIVLGGGHDLTDNLNRMKMDSVQYVSGENKTAICICELLESLALIFCGYHGYST